jgi:hypothetical protein
LISCECAVAHIEDCITLLGLVKIEIAKRILIGRGRVLPFPL